MGYYMHTEKTIEDDGRVITLKSPTVPLVSLHYTEFYIRSPDLNQTSRGNGSGADVNDSVFVAKGQMVIVFKSIPESNQLECTICLYKSIWYIINKE